MLRFSMPRPRCLQLFDVWFQPKANAIVSIKPDVMSLECRQCVLDGSHHVTDLKLNDVFNVLVQVGLVVGWLR